MVDVSPVAGARALENFTPLRVRDGKGGRSLERSSRHRDGRGEEGSRNASEFRSSLASLRRFNKLGKLRLLSFADG